MLPDYVVPTASIPLGDTRLTVRGINLDDVTLLLNTYGQQLSDLIDSFEGNAASAKDLNPESILTSIPDVVCHAIALCAGEPTGKDKVRLYPFSTQLRAAIEIWRLTVDQSGGFPKLVEDVTGMIAMLRSGLPGQADEKVGTGT